MARHGGGAFSGKDPSKVDRSAAYAMRWIAKNVVAAGLASRCEVQVAYAIGKAQPVGLFIETFGTEKVAPNKIVDAVMGTFDLRPAAIIRDLNLLRPIYSATASYGHFGRELPDFTWEKTDRAAALKEAAKFMGITDTLSGLLDQAFNHFAKVSITDAEVKKLIALAMAPSDLKAEDILNGNWDNASSYFINVLDDILEYNAVAPSQQLDTTKGTVYGALNAVTGYFQNVRSYNSKTKVRSASDAQLDSLLFGNVALRTQKIFDLCTEASKSTLFLN
jgi:hypothetical protein